MQERAVTVNGDRYRAMLNEFLFTKVEEEDCGKDKCYADKPKTIDALKDNIREAIGEKQLHTIDNVLKNWTDRVGYCRASRGSQKDCTFK